jgi:plastocyanin
MIKSSLMVILVIIMVLSTALAANAATYAPSPAPVIVYFNASSTQIQVGDTVTLDWKVEGAEEVELIGLEKDTECTQKDSIEVWPMKTTTYVLNAYGPGNTMTTQAITVNVGDPKPEWPPYIEYFVADKYEIEQGESVKIKFKMFNVEDYKITGLEKLPECLFDITEDEIEIWPMATTTYILEAYGKNGQVASKVLTITVNDEAEKVSINKFSANPSNIKAGQKATLSWDVDNAKSVKIEGVANYLQAKGSKDIYPQNTTAYKLVAEGENGDIATKTVVVEVQQSSNNVEITNFSVDKNNVSRGTLVKLSWTTKNAESCTILTDDGLKLLNRPANGSISITPNKTRTYTLYAGSGSDQDEESITVVVN